MSNKYAALSTLGLGLMQFGSQKADRDLRAHTLKNEQARNEKLDALADRQAYWAQENAVADRELKSQQIASQTELNRQLGLLHGANAGKTVEETKTVIPESNAKVGLLGAQTSQAEATTALTNAQAADIPKARELAERIGDSDIYVKEMNAEVNRLLSEANAGNANAKTELLEREAQLKEWLGGAKWDSETESLASDPLAAAAATALKSSSGGNPTASLQIAAATVPAVTEIVRAEATQAILEANPGIDQASPEFAAMVEEAMPTEEQIKYIATLQAVQMHSLQITDPAKLQQEAELEGIDGAPSFPLVHIRQPLLAPPKPGSGQRGGAGTGGSSGITPQQRP